MATDQGLSFSNTEAAALKQIVADWLNEAIVVPPFEPEIDTILKKLGLEATGSPPFDPPVSQG